VAEQLLGQERLSTAEVAHKANVHRDTLLRWLRQGHVPEPKRDRHGWRVFTAEEAEAVVAFAAEEEAPYGPQSAVATLDDAPEVARLKGIDWDFADANTSYLTHSIHPYPAKFIPQIPNALIQELSSVGETVADIFCGSGTTLVEALLLKRHAVGIDANPLACLISEAKTARLASSDGEQLLALAARAAEMRMSCISMGKNSLFGQPAFTSSGWRPDNEALSFWFDDFIVEELAEIRSWCDGLSTEPARKVALAAFSSIVVAVSRQDSDTRYVRRDKRLQRGDAFTRFAKSLEDAARTAIELGKLLEQRFDCRVVCDNVLNRPSVGRVQLVVCSPPYPNAYSYHLYHMTRMLWLGMDQPTFKKVEIGSHRKYSRKGPNGATEETFRGEMGIIFDWLRGALDEGRFACFVVGNSRIKGRIIDNADLLASAASEYGFTEVARIPRRMQDAKKSFNPAIGKIKTEQILILRNMDRKGAHA
jgi:site-specific DNA-methyltransferase (cytosine-N4-specific)